MLDNVIILPLTFTYRKCIMLIREIIYLLGVVPDTIGCSTDV